MTTKLILMTGEELIRKILNGERVFKRIKLNEGEDLSKYGELYHELERYLEEEYGKDVEDGYEKRKKECIKKIRQEYQPKINKTIEEEFEYPGPPDVSTFSKKLREGKINPFKLSTYEDISEVIYDEENKRKGWIRKKREALTWSLHQKIEEELKKLRNNLVIQDSCLKYVKIGSLYLPYLDAEGTDFEGANLEEADLFRANLSNANLSGAICRETDFSFANLKNSNLSNSCLEKADFFEANLSNANLGGAICRETDFSWAILWNVNLYGADLFKAIFSHKNWWKKVVNLEYALNVESVVIEKD